MAYRSGIATQLGFAVESTVGTYATPDHFLEYDSETIKNTIARMESKALRANNRVLRTDRWAPGAISVAGDIEVPLFTKGMLPLYKAMFGGLTSSADGAGFKWQSAISDPYGYALTMQVARPDINGTINPFSYLGCKVSAWDLSGAPNDYAKLKLSVSGNQEVTNQTLAAASYPSTVEPLNCTEGTITIAGVSYNITNFSISNTVGIKLDRYYVGSQFRKEPVVNAYDQPKVSFTADFDSLTPYQLYTAGTLADIELTFTGTATYDTGKHFKVTVSVPNVRFDGDTPNVAGPDILQHTMTGVGLYDGSNDAISLAAYTSESAL